jgi:hypothetical protein
MLYLLHNGKGTVGSGPDHEAPAVPGDVLLDTGVCLCRRNGSALQEEIRVWPVSPDIREATAMHIDRFTFGSIRINANAASWLEDRLIAWDYSGHTSAYSPEHEVWTSLAGPPVDA